LSVEKCFQTTIQCSKLSTSRTSLYKFITYTVSTAYREYFPKVYDFRDSSMSRFMVEFIYVKQITMLFPFFDLDPEE